jgi:hypothetical protein
VTVDQTEQCLSGLNGSTPLSAARRWEHTRVLASKLGSEEATGPGRARPTNFTGSLQRLQQGLPASSLSKKRAGRKRSLMDSSIAENFPQSATPATEISASRHRQV